jgi:flavin reductase (DIM6/NTAB) family NADH-FMN oxidoreductase RutF
MSERDLEMPGTGPPTETFNALMGDLDHPVVVVTTAVDDVRSGCLVGFHSQCGMSPPRYAVWLSKANHTYRVAALADVFAVHFLRRQDGELAVLFGTETGDEVDKFEHCAWTPGLQGVPLLDACPDRFVGWRTSMVDPGADHVCMVLEPVDASHEGTSSWLGFQQVRGLEAGHPAEERQRPA